jgi:2-oxoacid:acceptor oxidoreductase gamma subunit (pyruvate/2-ketoisovalerate family)
MSERVWEIRWHGRGGQGTVTAANLLARAALYNGFRGTQAFPFFGAERRGAPVRAFTRISKTPILVHSQVYNPDAIIVLDSTLMRIGNVLEGAKENAFLIVNSTEGEKGLGPDRHFNTCAVDATGIALELGLVVAGQPVASTPMLGAFSRATKLVSMESISRAILEEWGGGIGQKNVKAAEEAYERTSTSRKE